MLRTLTNTLALTGVLLGLGATLALASWTGTVSRIEDKGVVTVKTDDGQEYTVQMRGVRVGDQVECDTRKDGKVECKEVKKGGM